MPNSNNTGLRHIFNLVSFQKSTKNKTTRLSEKTRAENKWAVCASKESTSFPQPDLDSVFLTRATTDKTNRRVSGWALLEPSRSDSYINGNANTVPRFSPQPLPDDAKTICLADIPEYKNSPPHILNSMLRAAIGKKFLNINWFQYRKAKIFCAFVLRDSRKSLLLDFVHHHPRIQ